MAAPIWLHRDYSATTEPNLPVLGLTCTCSTRSSRPGWFQAKILQALKIPETAGAGKERSTDDSKENPRFLRPLVWELSGSEKWSDSSRTVKFKFQTSITFLTVEVEHPSLGSFGLARSAPSRSVTFRLLKTSGADSPENRFP